MYLTRMELNTRNMDTIRLLGSQEKIHGMVESGFSSGDLSLWETGCIC